MEPADALREILVNNYDETREDYSKLEKGQQATFGKALDDLYDPF